MKDVRIGAIWYLSMLDIERISKKVAAYAVKNNIYEMGVVISQCGNYADWYNINDYYHIVGRTATLPPISDVGYWLSVKDLREALINDSLGDPFDGKKPLAKIIIVTDKMSICVCPAIELINGCPSARGEKCRSK